MTSDFIDYLVSLAPDGETFLVVRQKPQLKDGQIQLHADGAVKATWPAFLPTKVMKEEQSWYGNTASFILDRFENGRVSASAANCEYVLCMVLDDVGDPEKAPKTPPIEPTWVMQTSEKSYQWGYAFGLDDQPTKAEFSAAITAIAAAGYTDTGAVNPVRNFRLPGSVNIKPGRDGFVSRLVEFHPKRQFTLPQICEALGVVPGEASEAFRPIRISDDGADDVLAWLSGQGLVLQKPNLEGWAGVICPNNAEHTDGNPEGRYNPATRAYCCYHGHCTELDSSTFLKWVADNGGPTHAPGLRDELLAGMMAGALNKLHPTEKFPDEAARVIAEVERKELGRTTKADWYGRFCYVQEGDHYFDLQDRREVSRQTFNALFRHVECRSIHGKKPKIEASVCFDENRQDMGARTLVGITYAAGEGVLVARDGDVYGNRWRDARPPVTGGGDISPWLDHCATLIPEESEREHVFNVMAYKVQHPEVKINHAVLHGGDQGCGKDTLWAPFIWAVCGPQLKNRGLLDNDTLGSQWGYALESEILILNELKEPEAKGRRALANKLKPVIAAPPDMLTINRKGLHPYDSLNRMFVLAFSNDPVPISLDSQDRRWFAIWSTAPRMAPEAAHRLWQWYRTGGYEAIACWLHARDVSAFNPAAAPAWTEFKANLVEHGMSMAESYLVEMMRGRQGEFARGVVGSPFHGLCDRVAGSAPSGVKIPQAALLHALKEAGWINLGRIASADYPSKKNIYCHPSMTGFTKSEMRRLVEEPVVSALMRVK